MRKNDQPWEPLYRCSDPHCRVWPCSAVNHRRMTVREIMARAQKRARLLIAEAERRRRGR